MTRNRPANHALLTISCVTTITFLVIAAGYYLLERTVENPIAEIATWNSGDTKITLYGHGVLRVSGMGKMENYPGSNHPYPYRKVYDRKQEVYAPWRGHYRESPGAYKGESYDFHENYEQHIGEVIVEEGVTHIGIASFRSLYQLRFVTVPASVEYIGAESFWGCLRLTSITILRMSPPEIEWSVFEGVPDYACLYVHPNSLDAYRAADGWKDFECIKPLSDAPKD